MAAVQSCQRYDSHSPMAEIYVLEFPAPVESFLVGADYGLSHCGQLSQRFVSILPLPNIYLGEPIDAD